MKIVKVEYECIGCGADCITTNHNLRYRKHHQNEPYCQKCLIKLEKSANLFDAIPLEHHGQIFDGQIDHDLAIKYLSDVGSNISVKFKCKKCQQIQITKWNKLKKRKNGKLDKLCYRCLQTRINTSEEMVQRHSDRSKLLWANGEYRRQCLKSFESHNKRMQQDVEYAAKHRRKSRSISGAVKINNQSIRFDSAFELFYIDYIYDKCEILRRCEYAIAYDNHFYHPDFFVVLDGCRMIVEIKGYYNNRVEEKQKAAIQYVDETDIADDYVLYTTEKLLDEGILRGVGGGHMWRQIRDLNNVRTIEFSETKHQRIAEVGRSRYLKEIES
jgi:hypothetical protein